MSLQHILRASFSKPLKIDVRNVCEHNLSGPITRTFSIPRKELVDILDKSPSGLIDRVDVTEFENETRATVYNMSQMDSSCVKPIREASDNVVEWDLDPQYGEWSARAPKSED